MIQAICILLLFVLPFIVNPFNGGFYEFPKVIVAEVIIEMLMVYFLMRHKLRLKWKFLIPVGILFVLSSLGLFLFPKTTGFFGNQFRLQGTFLLWHLLIWVLISSLIELKLPKLLSYLLMPLLLLVTFFIGESNGRSIATLGEPNSLAAVAIFFWPFSYFLSGQSRKNIVVKIFPPILAFIIIFLSQSRSGLIALVIQLGFLLILRISQKWKIALIGSFLILFCALLLPLFDRAAGYKFEDRAEVWRVSLISSLQSPILGWGFGNIESALKNTSQKLNSDLQYQYVDSAHNIFLDYTIAGGLLGLSALLALISLSLRNFIRQRRVLEVVLLLGLLTVLSFNPVSVVILIAFWWLIGQGFRDTQ